MAHYQYQPGFREEFIQMIKDSRAPKCKVCNRPQRPDINFANCPRCGWLLCPYCQGIHKPERHDWKEGNPTDLTNCEMCGKPSEDLAPCTACLYILCPRCRTGHTPEGHDWGNAVLLTQQHREEISRMALARVGNPPHGEPPETRREYEPDCPDCQKWYEGYMSAMPEVMTVYMEEQGKAWNERYRDIMEDLGISEEEIGGPL